MTTILEEARALLPTLRAIKADLHRHPELSFAETRTTRVIRETLLELDLEPVALDLETATVALLRECVPPAPRWRCGRISTPLPSRSPRTTGLFRKPPA